MVVKEVALWFEVVVDTFAQENIEQHQRHENATKNDNQNTTRMSVVLLYPCHQDRNDDSGKQQKQKKQGAVIARRKMVIAEQR
jgi:hypothetical protein